jgi:glycosyltransferase involved in cell wall biosynthesis
MKLLIFIHSLATGGAERVTVNLANLWSERGWDLAIVTVTGADQDFYELHSGVRRISLNMDMKSSNPVMAIMNNFRRLYAVRKLLKTESPDVALAMMSTANILLSLASLGTGITVIGSERIYPPRLPIGRVWSWLRQMSYPLLNAVVAQTSGSAEWLRTNTRVHRVSVIPNPVVYPLANHEPRVSPEKFKTDCDEHLLLSVGRLVPQKGFDRLLHAFAKLSPLFPDWYLVIVGEGDCRDEFENMVLELDIEEKVYFPGAVGNIGEWYKYADIYVMTSLFEGFPNTLAEAMAHGLPVVSVDCETGPRDIIRHEVDGLLVPQNDQSALIDAVAELMSDSILRNRYAERCIDVRERFSLSRIAKMWEDLFAISKI